jgi:DNA-binding CsgD family transcriptional regulator
MKSLLNQNDPRISLMLLSLLFFLSVFTIWNFFALRRIKLKKLKLEFQNKKIIHQFEKLKSVISPKYILGSQLLEEKIDKVCLKLSSDSFKKFPELSQSRIELIHMKELIAQWRTNIDKDYSLIELEQYSQELPALKKLNHTEQRILLYSIRGFPTSEIALIMSISQQHVRNTKSKTFKILTDELGEEMNITQLQKLLFRNP